MHEARATLPGEPLGAAWLRVWSRPGDESIVSPLQLFNASNRLAVQPREANFLRNLAPAFTHYLSERPEMTSQ